ncbi:hypothetical protein J007_02191 [Cryptococcus neoformans]|nr:hypothetical protein J007_02191 [Cryptococcus neoformans var. grubii]OXC62349.1 hypothetical protein C358_02260 [Cryptococcus neoformans var. grubii MW-RSA852]
MVKFTLFLFIFFTSTIFISQAAEAPVPVGVTSREEHLSNAERLRRGLPLKKPKRYYDPRQLRPHNTPLPSPPVKDSQW